MMKEMPKAQPEHGDHGVFETPLSPSLAFVGIDKILAKRAQP